MQLQGDIGIFVLGRKILVKNPTAELYFNICSDKNNNLSLSLFKNGITNILKSKTKFGRIGIIIDRKNFLLIDVALSFDNSTSIYLPQDKRAEKKPCLKVFKSQALKHLALEGLSDSVEFRRLARKHIRYVKQNNCDTLFFPEPIFGDKKTKKILQHIAGTQIKVFTADDFFNPIIKEAKQQKITIKYADEDPLFLKKRAETILQTKLGSYCFKK